MCSDSDAVNKLGALKLGNGVAPLLLEPADNDTISFYSRGAKIDLKSNK